MAEDDAQKTEDPTQKKLSKAREKGQVPSSQEVKNWAIIMGGTIAMAFMAPGIMRDVSAMSTKFIESPESIPFDFEHLRLVFKDVIVETGIIIWPLMGVLVVAALVANLFQTGLLWSPEKVKPDPSKISILKGLKNKVSVKALVEFLKGIFKLCLTSVVAFGLTLPFLDDIAVMPAMDFVLALDRIYEISLWMMLGTILVMTVIAGLDFAFVKYSHNKELMMSKQEVKDEHKESEGDPHVKARIRKLRQERAQQRMMGAVPEADVVVTNPTHFAVALQYKLEEMTAPRLVAKGMDSLAQRIREVAEENDVPIVENPPLARAIYAAVELDEEIPEEHYKAVAEVIGYVMRLRGDLPMH